MQEKRKWIPKRFLLPIIIFGGLIAGLGTLLELGSERNMGLYHRCIIPGLHPHSLAGDIAKTVHPLAGDFLFCVVNDYLERGGIPAGSTK